METMFLPMSCTSPFTVAKSTFPAFAEPEACFSASIAGCKIATAFFIVRAVFTTCGRNIFPAPNRLPTLFIPLINGPSMISTAWAYCVKAPCKSASK